MMAYETVHVDDLMRQLGKTPHRAHPAVKPPPLPVRVGAVDGPVTLELPLPPKALKPNARVNWRVKAAAVKKARSEAGLLARINRPPKPFSKATLHATFYMKQQADEDNLTAWLKSYIDGLQDGGVVEDDQCLTILPPAQVVDRKQQTKVVLRIEEEKSHA